MIFDSSSPYVIYNSDCIGSNRKTRCDCFSSGECFFLFHINGSAEAKLADSIQAVAIFHFDSILMHSKLNRYFACMHEVFYRMIVPDHLKSSDSISTLTFVHSHSHKHTQRQTSCATLARELYEQRTNKSTPNW